jgi:hypothetical protein
MENQLDNLNFIPQIPNQSCIDEIIKNFTNLIIEAAKLTIRKFNRSKNKKNRPMVE